MKFIKYPKITNHYQIKDLIDFKERVPKEEKWLVSEKIHGANFQFKSERPTSGLLKDSDFYIGSRNNWVNLDFYKIKESGSFINTYHKIKRMMEDLYFKDKSIDSITLYGEIYGNGIQKGVFYSKQKDFIAFDIMINDGFMDHDYFITETDYYQVPHVETLLCSSLESCLNYDISFDSREPNEEYRDNLCEGVVIRPKKPYYSSRGSFVILKHKNSAFSETRNNNSNPKKELKGADLEVYNIIKSKVNDPRINSSISKFDIRLENIPLIMKEIYEDILTEVLLEYTLLKRENVRNIYRLFNKEITNRVRAIIKESMLY